MLLGTNHNKLLSLTRFYNVCTVHARLALPEDVKDRIFKECTSSYHGEVMLFAPLKGTRKHLRGGPRNAPHIPSRTIKAEDATALLFMYQDVMNRNVAADDGLAGTTVVYGGTSFCVSPILFQGRRHQLESL